MKKCIASFLICFVFAFSVIMVFGCLDNVFAEEWTVNSGYGGFDEPFSMTFNTYYSFDSVSSGSGSYSAMSSFFNISVSNNSTSTFILPTVYENGDSFGFYFVVFSTSSFSVRYSNDVSIYYDDGSIGKSGGGTVYGPQSASYYSQYGFYALMIGSNTSIKNHSLEPRYNYMSFSSSPVLTDVLNLIYENDFSYLVIVDDVSYEFSEDLGSLTDISYKQLWEKTTLGHDVYYKFDWNTKTSSGVDLTQENYDVLYYWECSADVVSLFGNKSTIDPLYSDNFLCKSKQDGKVYSIVEKSSEGDFASIFNEIIDQQPLVTRSFDVKSTLHVAPVFYDGSNYYIGYWSHITFDNLANSEPIQDAIEDEFDGNGLEADYNISSEDPTISSSSGSSTIGVGSTIDEAEHNSNSGTSSSVNLDESSTNISDAIGMFVGAIKSFVSLVTVTFSFLPDWVLAFVSLSVIIFCIMIVKRAIF